MVVYVNRCELMQEVGRIHQMVLCALVDGRFLLSITKVCKLKSHPSSLQCYLLRHKLKFCFLLSHRSQVRKIAQKLHTTVLFRLPSAIFKSGLSRSWFKSQHASISDFVFFCNLIELILSFSLRILSKGSYTGFDVKPVVHQHMKFWWLNHSNGSLSLSFSIGNL